jgi:hypothetical protein
MDFKEFPKMARLSRDTIITEKIDGTNASIFIQRANLEENIADPNILTVVKLDGLDYSLRAGSRNKWVTPGKTTDNYGFASWVLANAKELVKLGEGHHFGEWWGNGIQRGYGLKEKRFSLFNVVRWNTEEKPACCHVVPILSACNFDRINATVENTMKGLIEGGSQASPGFMKPEGIVIWHTAANVGFKKTVEKDEIPKSLQ